MAPRKTKRKSQAPKHEEEDDSPEEPTPLDLVRLTIPRRVYTQSHIDYVAEAMEVIHQHRERIAGLRITWQAPVLRHFTARFQPVV